MENKVQFTDILKTLVQCFNKNLDQIENSKFRLRGINTEDKVQSGIMPVDEFIIRPTDQAATENNQNYFIEPIIKYFFKKNVSP